MKELQEEDQEFAFTGFNYKLLLIGIGVIIVGFLLLMGGGSEDPNEFNPAIFNAQRLYVAPLILLAGYMFLIYAIMKKPPSPQD